MAIALPGWGEHLQALIKGVHIKSLLFILLKGALGQGCDLRFMDEETDAPKAMWVAAGRLVLQPRSLGQLSPAVCPLPTISLAHGWTQSPWATCQMELQKP